MNSIKSQIHPTDFPALLERYFCDYLRQQRNASPETISSYRDTFRLFLQFSQQRFRKAPASLTLADLDACLLYTSPSPRDPKTSRMPSSA